MQNYHQSLGLVIKIERRKRNMKVQDLALETNYSRSYISRIENGYSPESNEVYTNIFNFFNITFKPEQENKKFEFDLDKAHNMFLYLTVDHDYLSELLNDEKSFLLTRYYSYFMIIKLIYYIQYKSNDEITSVLIDEIKNVIQSYSGKYKQIIYDYLGCYYMNHESDIASKYFSCALEIGYFDQTTNLLHYHLGIYHAKKYNLGLGLHYLKTAFAAFSEDLNIKRMIFTKQNIANIYSTGENYELANKYYNQILSFINLDKFVLDKVLENQCWNYIKWEKFSEALSVTKKIKNYSTNTYMHLSMIYINTNQIKKACSIIEKGINYSSLEIHKLEFSTLKMHCTRKNMTREYEDNLINIISYYEKIKEYESLNIYLTYIIDYYEHKHFYKEALYYSKKQKIFNC